jgi:hypothetical protein
MRTLVRFAALLVHSILAVFRSREEQAITSQDLLGHMEPSWFQHRFVFNMKLVMLRFERATPRAMLAQTVSCLRSERVHPRCLPSVEPPEDRSHALGGPGLATARVRAVAVQSGSDFSCPPILLPKPNDSLQRSLLIDVRHQLRAVALLFPTSPSIAPRPGTWGVHGGF